MVDFQKINSQFDLKNLDIVQIAKILREHQNSLIKVVLVIGALLMAGRMFNDYRTQAQALRTGISQAQEKLTVLKARDAAMGDLQHFKSSLPGKLNEFELITLISNYAQSLHVTITSLSPAESKDMGLYDVINVSFEAVSDNFKDMLFFLRKIERSNYPLRVDSWSGHETENGKIVFRIEIDAVIIHT